MFVTEACIVAFGEDERAALPSSQEWPANLAIRGPPNSAGRYRFIGRRRRRRRELRKILKVGPQTGPDIHIRNLTAKSVEAYT